MSAALLLAARFTPPGFGRPETGEALATPAAILPHP